MRRQKTYLLKLWNDGEGTETWRASLENIKTKEQIRFVDIRHLSEFIGSALLFEVAPDEERS